MREKQKKLFLFVIMIFVLCLSMAFIEIGLHAKYLTKSIAKWLLFVGVPVLYLTKFRDRNMLPSLKPDRNKLFLAFGLGLVVYGFILGGYFIFRSIFDFSNIVGDLEKGEGINRSNFIYVAIYISFINSLLEEFFFRIFIYFHLKQWIGQKYAMFLSAITFSLYHVAILDSWFSPFFTALLIFGLLVAGYIFIWINEKTESVYSSWIIHMFANFATNTIGLLLFGIL